MRHLMRYIKSYLISYFAHQNLFTIVFKIYEISTQNSKLHYDDVTMSLMASQSTSLTIVYWTIYSGEFGEFSAQMASNAENVSIWWRHHGVSWPQVGWFIQLTGKLYRDSRFPGFLPHRSIFRHMRKSTDWGLKITNILQTTFPNAYSGKTRCEF